MVDVPVRDRVAERLRTEAQARGIAVQELIEEAVTQYLATPSAQQKQNGHRTAANDEQAEQLRWVNRQQALYESQHAALYEKYAGQYIAMHDGDVLDYDVDRTVLRKRIDRQFAGKPVFVTPVLSEPRQIIQVHSTRLVR